MAFYATRAMLGLDCSQVVQEWLENNVNIAVFKKAGTSMGVTKGANTKTV